MPELSEDSDFEPKFVDLNAEPSCPEEDPTLDFPEPVFDFPELPGQCLFFVY
jgi:hypothetical protein